MKKITLIICFVSALFFVSSCRHSSSPSTPQPAPAPTDTQDPPADTQKPGETPGTPGTTEPENTGSETQEPSESTENQEPSETTETPETPGTSEPEEPEDPESGNTGSETPETPTSPAANYTAENDVPATTQPFTADICSLSGKTLSFSNGNWTVVDIWTSPQFAAKIISKITYDNTKENPYNCTSIIYKFDFPRQNLTENEVNFEAYFENIKNNSDLAAIKDILNFSHGYLTDTSIVIIAETPVEVFSLVYLSKLNTITNTATNLTQSKYYIIRGQYETIYIYKDSEELSAAESNVFLQGTGIQYDTLRLINSMNVGDGDPAPFDSEYFNSSDEFDNSKIILADGEWTLVQNQIYTLSDGSIQEAIGYFTFSSEAQTLSFISGKLLQKVDLRFFEQMILQEAKEDFKAEYATLTTDREKFNYIISNGATGEQLANMIFAFVDGKILVVQTLISLPPNMVTETNTLDFSKFIKKDTTVKRNTDNTQYVFTTDKTAEYNTEKTIIYLIKNN